MDEETVKYSEKRFNDIKNEVGNYLSEIGYKLKKIQFVPISALQGDNLIEKSDNMHWY